MKDTQKQEIATIEKVNTGIIAQAEIQEVKNQGDVDLTNKILKLISEQIRVVEEKRKSFTAPLNWSLKEINTTFKAITNPLQTAKNILSNKVMAWRQKEQEKIRIEQARIEKEEERRRKIQEAHEKQGHEVSKPVIMTRPEPLKVKDTTTTRKVWKFKITDSAKVPREYMIIDDGKIREAVRNGIREIEGIKIYQEEIIVIR